MNTTPDVRYIYDHDHIRKFADLCPMEVSREGQAQPCDKPAVALRWVDAFDGSSHATPVCVNHCRKGEMVPLADVLTTQPGDVIDDVYELLNLPAGTLVRNNDGTLWERRNGNPRWVAMRPNVMIPEQHMYPSTVIWMPEVQV